MVIDFYKKVNSNTKGYELFNVVADDGDSIYSPDFEEIDGLPLGGQMYISENKIRDIVNEELDKRLGKSTVSKHGND